ncbi:unnamed protein product [Brugia timori]|uniref:Uncharacterized protein n=1 Tax=Brugia timori TaxID=42155 RepID=A0A3P7XW61_9BILA|nr:unnamed protein product [Brugia timori]
MLLLMTCSIFYLIHLLQSMIHFHLTVFFQKITKHHPYPHLPYFFQIHLLSNDVSEFSASKTELFSSQCYFFKLFISL